MSDAKGGASPDAQHAAVSARQVAVIGAIAGLLSALISVPTTLWTAKRASETAVQTVTLQLSAETEKSRAEFLRGQRQTLYSTIAAHEQALRDAELENFAELSDMTDARFKEVLVKGQSSGDQWWTLRKDKFTLDIIGSAEARSAFDALVAEHRIYVNLLWKYVKSKESGSSTNSLYAIERQLLDSSKKIDGIEDQLKAAARADMGAK